MISNLEIESICKEQKVSLNFCNFKDLLQNKKYKSFAGIINLQSSSANKNGTHRLCYVQKGQEGFYFDSFGVVAPLEVTEFVKLQDLKHFGYNTREIQNLKSEKCGYFCLALLIFLKHNKGKFYNVIDKYLNMFSYDTELNDNI